MINASLAKQGSKGVSKRLAVVGNKRQRKHVGSQVVQVAAKVAAVCIMAGAARTADYTDASHVLKFAEAWKPRCVQHRPSSAADATLMLGLLWSDANCAVVTAGMYRTVALLCMPCVRRDPRATVVALSRLSTQEMLRQPAAHFNKGLGVLGAARFAQGTGGLAKHQITGCDM